MLHAKQRDHVLCLVIVCITEGPLKKLYERIRSQRENWQQRSLYESHEIDTAAAGSPSESAVLQHTCREGSLLILCMYSVLLSAQCISSIGPVSYTHLTLPTIYSV